MSESEAFQNNSTKPNQPQKLRDPAFGGHEMTDVGAFNFDFLLEGFQIIDHNWRYIYVNEAVVQQSRKQREELMGEHFLEVWPGAENSELYRYLKEALEEQKSHRIENFFEYPDGTASWFDLSIQPIPEGVFILSVDITKRKKTESELRDREAIFQTVFEASNVGKSITSMDGSLEVNAAFCEMLGYTKEEFKNKHWEDITPPEDVELVRCKIGPLTRGETNRTRFIRRYIHKNGSIVWTDFSTVIQTSEDGKSRYFITTVLDITEQINNRLALENKEKLLRLFIEFSPAPIAMFDTQMRYIIASNRYCRDFNLKTQKLKGRSHYEIFPEIPERWKEIHRKCLAGEIMRCDEDRFDREDGSTDWVRWEIHPWYSTENVIGGIIIFCEMITDLVMTREKALESDRLKSIFLANMSHEIRTPLNAILGFSGLIASGDDDPEEQIQHAELINEAGERLLGLINDIVDVSKIEAGLFSTHLDRVRLYSIVEHAYLAFSSNKLLKEKPGVKLEMVFPESLRNCMLRTDRHRLQQVIDNLLTNAVKFTTKGTIKISVERPDDQKNWIELSVSDTGVGIPEDKQDIIFERFRQVDENRFHEGSGLGLNISKAIIERLGGTIGVESSEGQGSRFYFTHEMLPMRTRQNFKADAMDPLEAFTNHEITIYIAEDDDYSYQYLHRILSAPQHKISRAENGAVLMDMFDTKIPDLLLLDINMPKKSGLECLCEIRKRGLDTKIIVQTGYAMSDDREKYIKVGCDAYLSKPVNRRCLFQTIHQVMHW